MNSSLAAIPARRNPGRDECAERDSFEFMRASECPPHTKEEIVRFLDTQNTAHPFQFPQWSGKDSYFGIYRQDSAIRWFAQCGSFYPAGRLLRPIRALSINRGPVSDDVEVMNCGLRRIVHAAEQGGFARIEMTPEWAGDFARMAGDELRPQGWRGFGPERTSLRLDLAPGLGELLSKFRKTTRYEIRRSEACDFRVRMAHGEAEYEEWLKLYCEMAREKCFAAEESYHLRQVLRWLGSESDRGGLLLAHDAARILGGIVIVRAGTRCWYLFGATSKNQRFSVGHLLQWRALQWAKEKGCSEYDFSGYRESDSSGPAFFKRGFCDNVVTFFRPSHLVVNSRRDRTLEIVSNLRRSLRL